MRPPQLAPVYPRSKIKILPKPRLSIASYTRDRIQNPLIHMTNEEMLTDVNNFAKEYGFEEI
jgi:hypothetical protein